MNRKKTVLMIVVLLALMFTIADTPSLGKGGGSGGSGGPPSTGGSGGGGQGGGPPSTGGSGGGGNGPGPHHGGPDVDITNCVNVENGGDGGNAKAKSQSRAEVNQNIKYEDRMQGVHYFYQGFLQDVPEGGPLPNTLPEGYLFLLEDDHSWEEVMQPLKNTGKPFAEWGWGFEVSVDIPNPGKKTSDIFLYFPGRISPIEMKKNCIGCVYIEGGSSFGFSVTLKYALKKAMERGGRRAVLAEGRVKPVNSASGVGLYTTVAASDDGTVATGGIGPVFAYTEQKGETIATLVVLKGEPRPEHEEMINWDLEQLDQAFSNKIEGRKAARNINDLFEGREIILQPDALKGE